MILSIPFYVQFTFILTSLLTFFLFIRIIKEAAPKPSRIIICLAAWLILQGGIAATGVYANNLDSFPPRFLFALLPPFICIVILFTSKKGIAFMDNLSLTKITWLNIVRIPVEVVLYWLFLSNVIPELMTFAGRNYDIIAGFTAPFVAFYGITKNSMNRSILILWNIVSLLLLLFIIGNAILSAPLPIQQFAFDQPNIGLLHFPYIWLPSFIVPIVFFGHLISLRQLWKSEKMS